MKKKYMWVFSPFDITIPPFPLFWSDKNIGIVTYEDLNIEYKEKIDYLLSDNYKNINPNDGIIIGWSALDSLFIDDEI